MRVSVSLKYIHEKLGKVQFLIQGKRYNDTKLE